MASADAPARWWTRETVAVVTGSNRGIGLDIVRGLAREGLTVVMTARDEGRGRKAAQDLHEEGLKNVVFQQLDISKAASVTAFVEWIQRTFGGLDILVNNAAVGFGDAVETMDTNYFGTKNLTEQLLPHLKASPAGARIVNVSSTAGWIMTVNDEGLRQQLMDSSAFDEERLDTLAKEFIAASKAGDERQAAAVYGMPYPFSKVLGNAYTRLLAQRVANRPQGSRVYVNCVHPGTVDTGLYAAFRASVDDASHAELKKAGVVDAEPIPTSEGADSPVWLALLPAGGPSGKFWSNRKEFSYVHGWA